MSSEPQTVEPKPIFKSSTWFSSRQSNKKRTWKGLKQIISLEKSLPWPENVIHYSSINAPPSFKPPEKFSDLSGLSAYYTDPQSRLCFANKEEYATLIDLPMDITAGYLAIRGATSIVC